MHASRGSVQLGDVVGRAQLGAPAGDLGAVWRLPAATGNKIKSRESCRSSQDGGLVDWLA
jgi:hypothetical protein